MVLDLDESVVAVVCVDRKLPLEPVPDPVPEWAADNVESWLGLGGRSSSSRERAKENIN